MVWKRILSVLLLGLLALLLSGCGKPDYFYIEGHYHGRDDWGVQVGAGFKFSNPPVENKIIFGGLKLRTGENIVAFSASKDSTDIPMQMDSTVTTELATAYPPEPGYKWVGFRSVGPVTTQHGDTAWVNFHIDGISTTHTIDIRGRDETELWSEGFLYQFSVSPEARHEASLETPPTGGLLNRERLGSVDIPVNALDATTTITIKKIFTIPSPTNVPSGYAKTVTARNLGPDGTTFSQPVTVTILYTSDEIRGIDENSLKAFKWTGLQWSLIPESTVNEASNTVTFQTTSFSTYGLGGSAVPTGSNISWLFAMGLLALGGGALLLWRASLTKT